MTKFKSYKKKTNTYTQSTKSLKPTNIIAYYLNLIISPAVQKL